MRAAIYNQYLDTMGGGERYTLSFAQALSNAGYIVDIQWARKTIKKKLEERFGMNLKYLNIVKDIKRGDGYDLCFWLSDGSVPLLRARKNFLHFQFPFKNINGKSLINKMKLFRVNKIICNSYFTKSFIDQEFGVQSLVIYPPVDVDKIRPKRKENIILYVGRFSQLQQAKNQHLLIEIFKKLIRKGINDWKLILAGGVEVGAWEYVRKLTRLVHSYPIKIVESPSFNELKDLYGKSKIFWSAAGFGINEKKEPEKVEHFGITVVEAMAAGVVPVVYSGGGHREIISEPETGYLWKKKGEFLKKTVKLIENQKLLNTISKSAKAQALVYEYNRFESELYEII